MGFFDKMFSGLTKTRKNIEELEEIFRNYDIDSEDFYDELEEMLIMADVGGETTAQIMMDYKRILLRRYINKGKAAKEAFVEYMRDMLGTMDTQMKLTTKPSVILMVGVNGVGKTTTCGMIIDYLCKQKKGPILVVDADANSNLNEVLGVEVETTLGDIREEMAHAEQTGTVPANMTKADYAEMKFNSALIEEDDYDMLVMGRTQGKGCYCFVNGVLKTQIDKYVGNYRYMVVDNEAGLEHISRGTLPHVDTMLLISDCSRRGIQAVGRIAEMIREMDLKPGEMKLIVNRAPNGELNPGVMEEINKYGLQLAGVLPQDDTVYTYDCEGKPSSQVPDTAPVKKVLAAIMQELKL